MKLSQLFRDMDGTRIGAGFAGPHPSGMSAPELATLLSEGTKPELSGGEMRQRIPARDFITPAQESIDLIAGVALRKASDAAVQGRDPRKILARGRDAAHDALIAEMVAFDTPGNAPATIARKGKDDPLIDNEDLLEATFAEYVIP